jgi:type IV pilus assembly protein PilP
MNTPRLLVIALVPAVLLVGCSRDMRDLEDWVAEMNRRPAARIEPLPQVQPYETFTYEAGERRSPFVADSAIRQQIANAGGTGLQPDFERPREFLEEFPLDTLRMVGTINLQNQMYGLIRSTDGSVHRVRAGQYMGQNHGRITDITEMRINLIEIIPDGTGGWTERRAAVALSE